MVQDEDLLMALLNSAPVVDGRETEELDGPGAGNFAAQFGGTGSASELLHLRRMRDALHEVIREQDGAADHLGRLIGQAVLAPDVATTGIRWELRAPSDDERLPVRAALAWSRVMEDLPGRLRPCANTECNLFLVDHSRPGTARWCSMATCGNRMKARAYASRRRGT